MGNPSPSYGTPDKLRTFQLSPQEATACSREREGSAGQDGLLVPSKPVISVTLNTFVLSSPLDTKQKYVDLVQIFTQKEQSSKRKKN